MHGRPHEDEAVVEMEPDEAGEDAFVGALGLLYDPGDDACQVGAGARVEGGAQLTVASMEEGGQEKGCGYEKRCKGVEGCHGGLILSYRFCEEVEEKKNLASAHFSPCS